MQQLQLNVREESWGCVQTPLPQNELQPSSEAFTLTNNKQRMPPRPRGYQEACWVLITQQTERLSARFRQTHPVFFQKHTGLLHCRLNANPVPSIQMFIGEQVSNQLATSLYALVLEGDALLAWPNWKRYSRYLKLLPKHRLKWKFMISMWAGKAACGWPPCSYACVCLKNVCVCVCL